MKPAGRGLAARVVAVCGLAVLLFSVLCLPSFVIAAEADLAPLFQRVAAEVNLPLPLLRAIAHVESKGHPFALNVEGKTLFFARKDEAIAAARRASAAGKGFDAGVMQINSQWLTRFHIPLDAVFDPEANIWLGGWILGQNLRQHGDLKTAVARYHSPNVTRGNRYVSQVKAALEEMGPAETPPAMAAGFVRRYNR